MRKILTTTAIAATALTGAAQVNSPAPEGYLKRAIDMYNDANYVGCTDQMRYLKDNSPTASELEDADYYIAMSALHLNKADAEALIKYYMWRYPSSARIAEARLALGNLYTSTGRYGEALNEFAQIADKSLDRSSADRKDASRAYCLLKQGEYDLAEPIYRRLARSKEYADEARFYEGYIAYVRKDYTKAAELFKKCNSSKAPGDMADYYLAQIEYLDGDYAKAASTARRLYSNTRIEPSFRFEAMRVAGESYYQLDDLGEALPLLREYAANTSDPLPTTLYMLGVTEYREGNYDEAVKYLTPVIDFDNAMGQSANLFIGQAMMRQANYSGAIIAFDRALRMHFDNDVREAAFYNYAVAKTEGGRIPFGNSVATFEEFLRAFPNSRHASDVREYLVAGYMTDNNFAAALASINQIKNPSKKILGAKQQVLYALGSREVMAGQHDAAIAHLKEAVALKQHDAKTAAESELWLGEAYYGNGDYAAAQKSYRNSLTGNRLSPENKQVALYGLGYSYFRDGDAENASRYFTDFINSRPEPSGILKADALSRIADRYFTEKDFGKAASAYNDAYRANPATGDYALLSRARMYGYDGNYKEKVNLLQQFIKEFPKSSMLPQAYIDLGESYAQLGDAGRSIESYSMVASRYPGSAYGRQANLLLALAYLNENDKPQAIDTYKQLITTAPGSEEGRQASDNLKQIMANDGMLDEYVAFINSVPGATPVGASDVENAAFLAAERDYLNKGLTGRLTDYLDRFPQGASRPAALGYAIAANSKAGNAEATIGYANELIETYPDNALMPAALKAKAEALADQGKGELALSAYEQLATTASTPEMLNEAQLGIMRTARDLGYNDRVIDAASAITSSSTPSGEQRSEAAFNYAEALYNNGDTDNAIARWNELSADLNDIYGTKALFRIAQAGYDAGDLKAARTAAEKLIDSDTPHNYWLARGFILLSDINRAEGNLFEADQYLVSLRDNYPGTETDIFKMIDDRLNNK
ncbi:MAG: tetratricopeptide repeat protein [Muribaculaceae bacterium]|nr:tetratricopeptide repeat protein [Muribaculaceae bacterium]